MKNWQILILVGIMIIFIAIGWYAFEYDGDDQTIKYSIGVVVIVGLFFMICSYFSYTKKKSNE